MIKYSFILFIYFFGIDGIGVSIEVTGNFFFFFLMYLPWPSTTKMFMIK